MANAGVGACRALYSRFRMPGLGRLLMAGARVWHGLRDVAVATNDGRILFVDLRQTMCLPYALTGEVPFERGETRFVRAAVRRGDFAIDIGANVGWYSTLLSEAAGRDGRVWAFEPQEAAFRLLRKSAVRYPWLEVLPLALSDAEGEAMLHVPSDAEGWFASLQNLDGIHAHRKQSCQVAPLDGLLERAGSPLVHFVKCDVEGCEQDVLRGAARLMSREQPPVWMVEVNLLSRFQRYPPERLREMFDTSGGYRAFRIDSDSGHLLPYPRPIDEHFNAAFVPDWLLERVADLVTH